MNWRGFSSAYDVFLLIGVFLRCGVVVLLVCASWLGGDFCSGLGMTPDRVHIQVPAWENSLTLAHAAKASWLALGGNIPAGNCDLPVPLFPTQGGFHLLPLFVRPALLLVVCFWFRHAFFSNDWTLQNRPFGRALPAGRVILGWLS